MPSSRLAIIILALAVLLSGPGCAGGGDAASSPTDHGARQSGTPIDAVGLLVVNTAASSTGAVADTIRINLYFRPRGGGTFVPFTEGELHLMLFDGVIDSDVDWRRLEPHLRWTRTPQQMEMWGRGTTHVGWVYSVPLMWRPHQTPRSSQVTLIATYHPPGDAAPIHTVPAVVTMRQ